MGSRSRFKRTSRPRSGEITTGSAALGNHVAQDDPFNNMNKAQRIAGCAAVIARELGATLLLKDGRLLIRPAEHDDLAIRMLAVQAQVDLLMILLEIIINDEDARESVLMLAKLRGAFRVEVPA